VEQKEDKALEFNSPSDGAVAPKASIRVRVEKEQQLNEMEWH